MMGHNPFHFFHEFIKVLGLEGHQGILDVCWKGPLEDLEEEEVMVRQDLPHVIGELGRRMVTRLRHPELWLYVLVLTGAEGPDEKCL